MWSAILAAVCRVLARGVATLLRELVISTLLRGQRESLIHAAIVFLLGWVIDGMGWDGSLLPGSPLWEIHHPRKELSHVCFNGFSL